MQYSATRYIQLFLVLLLPLAFSACADNTTDSAAEPERGSGAPIATLDVYKSPTCGCCSLWVDHLEDAGFATVIHQTDDLNQVKLDYGIAPQYQSCHTAVSPEGYVFEGHIPARYIQAFLENPPADAIGLAVPGMPLGSPGMEVGDNFTPYQVWLLRADGTSEIFVSVGNSEQQHLE